MLLDIPREEKMKKKKLLLWSLLVVVLASEGCATIRGMGDDIQSIGRAVKRTVSGGSARPAVVLELSGKSTDRL